MYKQFYSLESDKKIFLKLENLFKIWKEALKKDKNNKVDLLWNSDGIFPGYTKNKFKILFIGRENRTDYGFAKKHFGELQRNIVFLKIEEWKDEIKDENNPYPKFRSQYWPRIFKIMKGIKQSLSYKNLGKPKEYIKELLDEESENYNDFGFAFMELSKYQNKSKTGAIANKKLISRFLTDTSIEYIKKEINIINPDLIITMNLWDISPEVTESISKIFCINKAVIGKLYDVQINRKTFKLINLYHFSAIKSTEKNFYNPVIKIVKKVSK